METAYGDYRPLDESQQQIRLITIHAAEASSYDGSEAVVTCTLETVALRHANPFYALSYVWGLSTPAGPISVNGQTIHVRRNLWLFLLTLQKRFCRKARNGSFDRGSVRVWADYICIQQNDVRERNSQVAMMGDIYKAADAIYAWLGESGTPVDDGMRCIAETAALRKQGVSWAQIRREVSSIEAGIRSISTSQYWSRMWIKQEALLAKNLWFFHGQHVAHWQDMSFAIQLFRANTDHQSQVTSTRAMLSLFQAREGGMVEYELHDLVERFADARCQDPRDRIYALLALIDQNTSQQIVVDYQKPVLQVLLETYPHWTIGGVTKPPKDKIVPDTWAYHTFCKAIHRFLPSADFEALYTSKDARQEITAQGVFVATDASSVEWVCHIATIGGTTVDPVSCIHEAENEKSAFILRVSLRPYRSRKGTRSRQCFIYSDIVPDVDTLVVWIGSRVLFLQLLGDIAEDQAARADDLSLVGTGTEVREVGLATGGGDRLSRQLVLHPCLWLNEQLDDARLAILKSRLLLNSKNVSVTCNATAIILLLQEFRRHGKASAHGTLGGDFSTALDAEGEQSRLWSPYTFGIEHKLLQPCRLCRATGRSAALAKQLESAAKAQLLCECRWLNRTEC